jgi:lipopolysaccharide transport system permease protein
MDAPFPQSAQLVYEPIGPRVVDVRASVQIVHSRDDATTLLPVTILEPDTRWRLFDLPELWRFRELIYFLAWRDVKVRYKQTFLGLAWAVLQPALMMAVFTVCLSWMGGLSGGDCPYPLYAYLGFLPWSFFASAVANAAASVVGNERLVTKVYFPRLAMPFAAVGATAVDFVIGFALQLALLAAYGVQWHWQMPLLLAVWALLLAAALGTGTLLAALTVQFRDFRHALPFMLQFWMLATPAIYLVPQTASSGWATVLALVNPLNGLVHAHRAASMGLALPWSELGASALLAGAALAGGCWYFRRVEETIADII